MKYCPICKICKVLCDLGLPFGVELANIPPCPTKTTVKTQIWANACIGVASENRAGNI